MRKSLIFILIFCMIPGFITIETSDVVANGMDRYCQKNIISSGYLNSLALKSDGTVVAWGNNSSGQCNVPIGLNTVTSIAAGYSHSLALKSDETVVSWGNNFYGQCNVPVGLNSVVAIAAGGSHSLALKSDGTVVAWGNNSDRQANIPQGLNNAVAIAAGYSHSLALKSDGTVAAWGYNISGQCNVPNGLNNVVGIAAGYSHSLALKSDGTVVAWGNNSAGQSNVPTGLKNVIAIAAGKFHSLALKSDETVVAWGRNTEGQCNVPTGLKNVIAIDGGEGNSLAAKSDGTVIGWGDNSNRQCNIPEDLKLISVPVLTNGIGKVTVSNAKSSARINLYNSSGIKIASRVGNGDIEVPAGTGYYVNQIITDLSLLPMTSAASNTAEASPLSLVAPILFGGTEKITVTRVEDAALVKLYNSFGQEIARRTGSGEFSDILPGKGYFAVQALGQVVSKPSYTVSVTALNGANKEYCYNAISSGYYHSLIIKSDGTVDSWGDNSNGQCTVPKNLTDIIAVSAGGLHSIALKSDGTVIGWGDNKFGQCNIPKKLNNVVAITTSYAHSLALTSSRTVVSWGDNSKGQCTVPKELNDVVAIAGGYSHSMALKSDGYVVAWGENEHGQCNIPEGLNDVVAISAGTYHSLALKSNGTVVAWGKNEYGQCNVPKDLNDVVAISAGDDYSLALKSDGTIRAWGNFSISEELKDVAAISTSYKHLIVLKTNGKIVALGDNSKKQLSKTILKQLNTPPVLIGGTGKITVSGARNGFIVNLYNGIGQKIASRIGNGDIIGVPAGNGYYVKQSLKGLTSLPLHVNPSNSVDVSEAVTSKSLNKVIINTSFEILVESKLGEIGISPATVDAYDEKGTKIASDVEGAVEVETFASGYSIVKSKQRETGIGFNREGFKVVKIGKERIFIMVVPES